MVAHPQNRPELFQEVSRILSRGRPVSRENRIRWIRDTAATLDVVPLLEAHLAHHFGAERLEDLSPDDLLAMHEYMCLLVHAGHGRRPPSRSRP